MTGLLLHLSAPLQSWGSGAQANVRTSYTTPTRSGLIGLIACCMGRPRGSDNSDLKKLSFTVRVDRPGTLIDDFHTVGGRHGPVTGLVTADGGYRADPVLSHRYYLSDAAFTAAVAGPEEVVDQAGEALTHPTWAPHLGRRACLPDTPILIRRSADPVAELDELPLHRDTFGPVKFVYDKDPTGGELPPSTEYQDEPDSTQPRVWSPRSVWEETRDSPAPNGGIGPEFLSSLAQYLHA